MVNDFQKWLMEQGYYRGDGGAWMKDGLIVSGKELNEKLNNKMDKDFFGNVWIKADKDVREYPIGTKFKALMGGHWIRTEQGFKWCTGSTFPNVGGDWTGEVCLP